jgi:TPR repeat protein
MSQPALQDSLAIEYNRALATQGSQRLAHLLRAAARGCHRAQFLLALAYQTGQDAPRDSARSASWYERAAAGGNSFAMANLGMMWLSGDAGAVDEVEAYTWIRSAEALGRHELREIVAQLENRITGSRSARVLPLPPESPSLPACTSKHCEPSRCGDD